MWSLEETIMQRYFWEETEMAMLWAQAMRRSSVGYCEYFIGINIDTNGMRIE